MPDESLTLDQYAALKLYHDRTWTHIDMMEAARVLSALSQERFGQLPRFDSDRSGKLFAAIISLQALAPFSDKSIPVEDRAGRTIAFLNGLNVILQLYLKECDAQKVRGIEMIELTGFTLHVMLVLHDLVDEYMPTLNKNSPDYPTRQAGLVKLKGGSATAVGGSLDMLTETTEYSAAERAKLVTHLQTVLPKLVPRLEAQASKEIIDRLTRMQNDPLAQDLQPALGTLRDLVLATMVNRETVEID